MVTLNEPPAQCSEFSTCTFKGCSWTGVDAEQPDGAVRFRWVPALTSAERTAPAARIAALVARFLQRRRLLQQDAENADLAGEATDAMESSIAPSIT